MFNNQKSVYNFYNNTNTIMEMVNENNFRKNSWHTNFKYNEYDNDITILKSWIKPKSKVLDFGCGVGETSIILAKDLDCNVIGINIAPDQKKEMDINITNNRVNNKVNCILYNGENLPKLENDFDVIIFQESMCHVKNKQNIFNQFFNILKIGGIIYCQDWFIKDMKYSNDENIKKSNYYFKSYIETMNMYINYMSNFKFALLQYLDVKNLPKNDLDNMFIIGEINDKMSDIEKGGQYLSRAYRDGIFMIGIIVVKKI